MREGYRGAPPASTAAAGIAEHGLWFSTSPKALPAVLVNAIEDASNELSTVMRLVLQRAFERWLELHEHMRGCDRRVGMHLTSNAGARRASQISGIGEAKLGSATVPVRGCCQRRLASPLASAANRASRYSA